MAAFVASLVDRTLLHLFWGVGPQNDALLPSDLSDVSDACCMVTFLHLG